MVAIIGAGGFGREVAEYLLDAGAHAAPTGFLDDDLNALPNGEFLGIRILGRTTDAFEPATNPDTYLIAFGDPALRHRYHSAVVGSGLRLHTLIHPSAYVSRTATIGEGAIICPNAFVGAGARVGANAVVNAGASIGHDAVVGECAVIAPHAVILGYAQLGGRCLMGANSVLMPGVAVGADSKISAGSVVSQTAEDGSLCHGNPARSRVVFSTGVAS